jgi:RNA polymerase sigma-54 factor
VAIKQSLQIRAESQLQLTPQMRQSLRILQLSGVEIDQEVVLALECNPCLEQVEEYPENTLIDYSSSSRTVETEEPIDISRTYDMRLSRDTDSDLNHVTGTYDTVKQDTTLQDELLQNLSNHRLSSKDAAIARAVIGSLDERGYLTAKVDDLHELLVNQINVQAPEIEAMVHLVQTLSIPGIGAYDLADCLRLQLEQLGTNTPGRTAALRLVRAHLPLLAKHKFTELIRLLQIDREELSQVIDLIRTLDHAPGRHLGTEQTHHVVPDVYVYRREEKWQVTLNSTIRHRLCVTTYYQRNLQNQDTNTQEYLKQKMSEATALIRGLDQRTATILRVATEIVLRQQEFMTEGESRLKPLTRREIASALNLHESTVSRATDHKYMLTPKGIFEFKHFFTTKVGVNKGEGQSARAVQAQIRKMIELELHSKPVSDSILSKMLADKGMFIARRTVSKYREQMNIPPANQRKSVH